MLRAGCALQAAGEVHGCKGVEHSSVWQQVAARSNQQAPLIRLQDVLLFSSDNIEAHSHSSGVLEGW